MPKEAEPITVNEVLNSWREELNHLDHSRIMGKGDYSRDRLVINREDGHLLAIAGRLLCTEPTAMEQEDVENEKLKEVEETILNFERRIRRCSSTSLKLCREALIDKIGLSRVTQLARDELDSSASSLNPNIILTISVYGANRPGLRQQTFDVLASSKMTRLSERISCLYERIQSQCSTPTPKVLADMHGLTGNYNSMPKPKSRSSFFLINRTFYSDMQSPDAVDLSLPIRKWIESDKTRLEQLGKYEMRKMEETDWTNVNIQLSKPYTFSHSGKCEHYIVVEQLRLKHQYDYSRLSSWSSPSDAIPAVRETFHVRRKRRKCNICDLNYATWITMDDRLANDNPCAYCTECYIALHYDQQGSLLYNDFKVYPYIHDQ